MLSGMLKFSINKLFHTITGGSNVQTISDFNKGKDLLYTLYINTKNENDEGFSNEQKVRECIECFETSIKKNDRVPCSNLNLARIFICLGYHGLRYHDQTEVEQHYATAESYLTTVKNLYQQDKICGGIDYIRFVFYYRGVVKLLQKGAQNEEIASLFAEAKKNDLDNYLPDYDGDDPALIKHERKHTFTNNLTLCRLKP